MSYFSGDDALLLDLTIKQVLKDYLQSKFDTVYQPLFASYGGVDIVLSDVEATKAAEVGKPFIILTKDSRTAGMWGKNIVADEDYVAAHPDEEVEEGDIVYKPGKRFFYSYKAVCVSNAFSGAVVGAANPVPSDELLATCLTAIVDYYADEIAGLGLEEPQLVASEEQQDEQDRLNPFTLTFTVHAIPDVIGTNVPPIVLDPPEVLNIASDSFDIEITEWEANATTLYVEIMVPPLDGENEQWVRIAYNPEVETIHIDKFGMSEDAPDLEANTEYVVRYRAFNGGGMGLGLYTRFTTLAS